MLEEVDFSAEDYGPDIARILAAAGGGKRPMALVKTGRVSSEACAAVSRLRAHTGCVRSGLYLYLGCWDEAHAAADGVENPDGYFWHAIVHRQEPDPGNSGYWFRKTGKHPIFPKLASEADKAGYHAAREWDPFAFVGYCESARTRPGSKEERVAIEVQLLEWHLLFDHCARGQNC
jgi:hypothetical protein